MQYLLGMCLPALCSAGYTYLGPSDIAYANIQQGEYDIIVDVRSQVESMFEIHFITLAITTATMATNLVALIGRIREEAYCQRNPGFSP